MDRQVLLDLLSAMSLSIKPSISSLSAGLLVKSEPAANFLPKVAIVQIIAHGFGLRFFLWRIVRHISMG
jgi:hypothetical protein